MGPRARQFVAPILAAKILFTDNNELFVETQVTFLANNIVGLALF